MSTETGPEQLVERKTFGQRLEAVDRRWIYLLTAVIVTVWFLWKTELPQVVTKPALDIYETIESLDADDGRIVIVSSDWGPDIQAECRPQMRAVLIHLMRKRIPFAIVTVLIEAPPLAMKVAEEAAEVVGKEQGREIKELVDYTNWGYKGPLYDVFARSLMTDVQGMIPKDANNVPVEDIPMMQGIEDHNNIALIIDICGSAVYETTWVPFAYGLYRVPVAAGVTGVMAPTAFHYYDSGQLVGILAGMKGAAEYEALVGVKDRGTQAMRAQNAAHIWIVLLIVLGNIGYVTTKRAQQSKHG